MDTRLCTVFATREYKDSVWKVDTSFNAFSEIEKSVGSVEVRKICEVPSGKHYTPDLIAKIEPERHGWWFNFETQTYIAPEEKFISNGFPLFIENFESKIFLGFSIDEEEFDKIELEYGVEQAAEAALEVHQNGWIEFDFKTIEGLQTKYVLPFSDSTSKFIEFCDKIKNKKFDRFELNPNRNSFYFHAMIDDTRLILSVTGNDRSTGRGNMLFHVSIKKHLFIQKLQAAIEKLKT